MRRLGSTTDSVPASDDELKDLFSCIDQDASDYICMSEYFLWTLDIATQHGCGLEAIFKKYDKNKTGLLDPNEFALAVEDMGFAATFAHDLFIDLDDDFSGEVGRRWALRGCNTAARACA